MAQDQSVSSLVGRLDADCDCRLMITRWHFSQLRNTDDNFIAALRTFVTGALIDSSARENWLIDFWNAGTLSSLDCWDAVLFKVWKAVSSVSLS